MKHEYGVINAIVNCDDCKWETQNYKNARGLARIHATRHKHKVLGELTISFVYDGRK
ncbi:hypothetical protein LCGC14_2922540 [marine sediment metagenome]|uniref:Uncharacterized protein n=1 Tax=marine sediment metagenome TaxID=412755 RepID=A0A0F9AED8_9ZZZZ